MRSGLLFALSCAVLAAAPARAAPVVGIADQHVSAVTDPLFVWTGIKTVRMVAPWNAGLAPTQEFADRMAEARIAGLDMVVAFEHRRGEDCRVRACELPAPAELRAAFRAFRERWPWVTAFGAWNEGNHPSQPTADQPAAAAELYEVLAHECPDCRIAAADVVDLSGMIEWLRGFLAALGEAPRLWALHNYGDVTRGRTTMTEAMLALVPGDVWITETGGIVRWDRWPYDEERARASVERAFALADAHADRIPRLYLYQWKAEPDEAWDSGLLRPDWTPRPSFFVLAARLRPDRPPPPPPPPPAAASPAPRGAAVRVVWRPRLARGGIVRARVACAAWRASPCTATLVIRRRPARASLRADRRQIAPGRQRTLTLRIPARLRHKTSRLYAELRIPGRTPIRVVLRLRRESSARRGKARSAVRGRHRAAVPLRGAARPVVRGRREAGARARLIVRERP